MNIILLILAIIIVLTYYRTQHIYKAEYIGYSIYHPGFLIGSIIADLVHIIACWYVVKLILENYG